MTAEVYKPLIVEVSTDEPSDKIFAGKWLAMVQVSQPGRMASAAIDMVASRITANEAEILRFRVSEKNGKPYKARDNSAHEQHAGKHRMVKRLLPDEVGA